MKFVCGKKLIKRKLSSLEIKKDPKVVALLKKKSAENQCIQIDKYGKTAFHFASMTGNTLEAKMII